MKALAHLTFDKLIFDKDNDLHLVVSLAAPKLDWQNKRPPVLIIPVIDISGSMQGEKLNFAKESVCKLIDHLQPGDMIGLVTFESSVRLLAAPVEITTEKKQELKNKVKKLCALGSTAFSDGMLMALNEVGKADLPENMLVRVIMFTDGQANVGQKGKECLALLDKHLGRATISAFGYGINAEQEFLADLSSAARGNYAFIKDPTDAPAAFAKELGGLLSIYAQNIQVAIQPDSNMQIVEVITDVSNSIDNNLHVLKVPELLSEEVRNLVLKIKTKKLSEAQQQNLASIKITCDIVSTDGIKSQQTKEISIGATFVNSGEEQTVATSEVDAIVALAQMVKAQLEAEKLASTGQYDTAYNLMNNMSNSFNLRGFAAMSNASERIGGKMKSEQQFRSSSAYRRSTYSVGTRSYGASSVDADALNDMSEIGFAFSNNAQQSVMDSFAAPTQTAGTVEAIINPTKTNPDDITVAPDATKK